MKFGSSLVNLWFSIPQVVKIQYFDLCKSLKKILYIKKLLMPKIQLYYNFFKIFNFCKIFVRKFENNNKIRNAY